MKKALNTLLYGLPLMIASFIPFNEAKGQFAGTNNLEFKEGNGKKLGIKSSNTLYLTFQPEDLGLGIRYDRRIYRFGIYSSLSKGRYKCPGAYYIKDHFKFALGGLIQLKEEFGDFNGFLNGGLTCNTYGEKSYNPEIINENIFKPISFELGAGLRHAKFNMGIRYDPLKCEGSLDFGWILGKRQFVF